MTRIAHISDTHFGTDRADVTSALMRLLHAMRPAAIVWTGDITQRGTHRQFEQADSFARQLPPVPLLVQPGNHDLPLWPPLERLARPYRRYDDVFGAQHEPTLDLEAVHITLVDTTRRWRHQGGALSRRQIERVSQRLRQAPRGSWRVVATHHPLMVPLGGDGRDRPWRHRRALDAWSRAGADLLLSGHTHVPLIARPRDEVQRPWIVQAGSAVSMRLRQGYANAVNVLEQGADGRRRIERWDYDERARCFVRALQVMV